jgi:hypothetical protein
LNNGCSSLSIVQSMTVWGSCPYRKLIRTCENIPSRHGRLQSHRLEFHHALALRHERHMRRRRPSGGGKTEPAYSSSDATDRFRSLAPEPLLPRLRRQSRPDADVVVLAQIAFLEKIVGRLETALPEATVWSFHTSHVAFVLAARPEHLRALQRTVGLIKAKWPAWFMEAAVHARRVASPQDVGVHSAAMEASR